MKHPISLRLEGDILVKLDQIVTNSGYNRTRIIELSLNFMAYASKHQNLIIDDIAKQNWQFRAILNAYLTSN